MAVNVIKVMIEEQEAEAEAVELGSLLDLVVLLVRVMVLMDQLVLLEI